MSYFLILFASLLDPELAVRESAATRINQLVDRSPAIYGPRLADLVAASTEPEIRAAARPALATYHRWRINSFVPTTAPVWPSIDSQPMTDAPIPWFGDFEAKSSLPAEAASSRRSLQEAATTRIPNRTTARPYRYEYRNATERMVREMLRKGASHADADQLVGRMWALERSGLKHSDAASGWKRWEGGYPKPKGGTSEP